MKAAALALLLIAAPALAAEGPKIEKTSIVVSTLNRQRDEVTFTWTPKIQFKVYGPVAAGTEYVVDFAAPGGKPWVSLTLSVPELEAGKSASVEGGAEVPIEKGSSADGSVAFAIRLKDQVAFKGKAEVKKLHVNGGLPKYKNTFYHYVDEDWRLPIGEMWWNFKEDPEAPALLVAVWVRGASSHKDVGTLALDGKTYCSTARTGQGDLHDMNGVETGIAAEKVQWTQVVMWFNCTRAFNKHGPGVLDDTFHIVDKHPGSYEIKLMRDGKPARVAEFTVGEDGQIVDNGLADKNAIGGHRFLFPFKIVGDSDGKIDAAAWKGGVYGNPLAGFSL